MSTQDVKLTLEKQQDYVRQQRIQRQQDYVTRRKGGGGGLFDQELALKSMRSARYFSEAHAAADIIDNSIEAGARQVHVATLNDKNKIKEIAFIDDGSGIYDGFLPWAASWGGSAQHGDEGQRNIFGRFGFGLPTASINRGTAFDIISRTDGEEFKMVTVDIRNLPTDNDGLPIQPAPQPGKLPSWVIDYLMDDDNGFVGGVGSVRTVIVWRDLDRLASKTVAAFNESLQHHFGITYAGWLSQVKLAVNGEKVEPVDLLFLTPSARYFDVDGTRAEDHGTLRIPIKDQNGVEHEVTVRLSRMGIPAWEAKPEGMKGRGIRQVLRSGRYIEGILVTRHERFIETWKPRTKGISWNNYMRQVGVHIDFPPELDEMFGVTPDKQTLAPRDELIDMLHNKGLFKAIADLYKAVDKERHVSKAERASEQLKELGASTITEEVMDKFDSMTRPSPKSDDDLATRREEARKNLERTIKERAAKADVPEESIRDLVIAETEERRFKVERVPLGANGVFYNPVQRGAQTVLQINTDHRFYIDVYSKIPAEQYHVRLGLELLLFTLAYTETDAAGERAAWYLQERIGWSNQLLTQMLVQEDVISKSNLGVFQGADAAEVNVIDED